MPLCSCDVTECTDAVRLFVTDAGRLGGTHVFMVGRLETHFVLEQIPGSLHEPEWVSDQVSARIGVYL